MLQVYGGGPPPELLSSIRLVSGNTVTEAVSSFFRKPSLEGAASSTFTPAVNSNPYPQPGSARAKGIEEFKIAYGAAFATATKNGKWAQYFGPIPSLQLCEACTNNFQLFPFPAVPTPGGQLAAVLS